MSTATKSGVQEVATKLVKLCEHMKFEEAIQELYADNATHVETNPFKGKPDYTEGRKAILESNREWHEKFEVHSNEVGQPIIASNVFAVTMNCETTNRETGQKVPMSEVCVYSVENGKIVQANFFYKTDDK